MSAYRENAFHVLALLVLREVAVERELAGLVGAELERDALAGAGALHDAVALDGEAMGDVLRRERDLDQVVLVDGQAGGGKGVVVAGDRELADLALAGLLRGKRHEEQH